MSIAARQSVQTGVATPTRTWRWLTVVPAVPADVPLGGIWSDEQYAAEAGELTALLGGLVRLEAEILSI